MMRTAIFLLFPTALCAQTSIDTSRWRNFLFEAEVRLGAPDKAVRLEAGAVLEMSGNAADSEIGLRLTRDGKVLASETEHLRPVPQTGWGAGAEEELKTLARQMPGWRDRWFVVRVEASQNEAWFWFDGRVIASVGQTATHSTHSAPHRADSTRNAPP